MSVRGKANPLDRLNRFVIMTGEDDCTIWEGGVDQDGYPMFWFEGRTQHASRVLWTLKVGPIPPGLLVRHSCDNVECLNLKHMLLGTNKDNTDDAKTRKRLAGPRKIDATMQEQIILLRKQKLTFKEIGRTLGISLASAHAYSRGKEL